MDIEKQIREGIEEASRTWSGEGWAVGIEEAVATVCNILNNQWQPIETAPKDESWIITYTPNGYYRGVHHNRWSEKNNSWWKDNIIDLPTHWQPLPKPPGE